MADSVDENIDRVGFKRKLADNAEFTENEHKDCFMGKHFMIVEESRKDGINTIIYRFSDNYASSIYASCFNLDSADGEFAISYRQ